jgi:polyisoprenoid-binding protein YceI
MRCASLLFAALLAFAATDAAAAPRRMEFGPAASEVEFRGYGLGLMPIDGRVTRFSGWLTYDPDDRTRCQVELKVDVASLATEDPSMHDTVVGRDFLDAATFRSLGYEGSCDARGLGGMLDMHGVKRPFELSLTWSANDVVAEGRLRRADWGMTAMPFIGGRTVRIRVSVQLPASARDSGN